MIFLYNNFFIQYTGAWRYEIYFSCWAGYPTRSLSSWLRIIIDYQITMNYSLLKFRFRLWSYCIWLQLANYIVTNYIFLILHIVPVNSVKCWFLHFKCNVCWYAFIIFQRDWRTLGVLHTSWEVGSRTWEVQILYIFQILQMTF